MEIDTPAINLSLSLSLIRFLTGVFYLYPFKNPTFCFLPLVHTVQTDVGDLIDEIMYKRRLEKKPFYYYFIF